MPIYTVCIHFIYFRLSIQYNEFAAGCASTDTHHKVTTIGWEAAWISRQVEQKTGQQYTGVRETKVNDTLGFESQKSTDHSKIAEWTWKKCQLNCVVIGFTILEGKVHVKDRLNNFDTGALTLLIERGKWFSVYFRGPVSWGTHSGGQSLIGQSLAHNWDQEVKHQKVATKQDSVVLSAKSMSAYLFHITDLLF